VSKMYGNIEEVARIIIKGLITIMKAYVVMNCNPNGAYKELQ